jgi:hypothetical protein
MGGFQRRHSGAHIALDIFDNNNGIVDDNTDRKDKTE